ncbi:MAG: putative quinol monooxygenase [Pseudomonadota bacterium]
MIGVVAEFEVKEDRIEAFETAASELVEAVRANEPGVPLYELHRKRGSKTAYIMMERYDDQAALDAHGKTPHFAVALGSMGDFLAAAPKIVTYDLIV